MSQLEAVVACSTATVTIGEGDRKRDVELKVFPGNGLATVSTVEEGARFVGTVTALNVRQPKFKLKAAFVADFNTAEWREVEEGADAAYQAALHAEDPDDPAILKPGRGTKYVTVDRLRIAFTPDLATRSVSLHTGLGTPRLIGQARNVGDDDTETNLELRRLWTARFSGPDLSQELTEAAGNVWRAARDARARTEVQHG